MVLLRNTFIVFFLLLQFTPLNSQEILYPMERKVVDLQTTLNEGNTFQFDGLEFRQTSMVAHSIKCKAEDFSKLRILDRNTGLWLPLELDEHLTYPEWSFSQLQYFHPDDPYPQIRAVDQLTSSVEIHIFNPGDKVKGTSSSLELRNTDCECPQPEILNREDWCVDCPIDSTPEPNTPEFIIVHHSAGSNQSSNWAAVVRSIWNHHVNTRGWDDIGYNYLIDPEGSIYLGRGDEMQGAHFCGDNGGTLGICMMGLYTDVEPTMASLQQLNLLTSWQNCKYDIEPLEEEFHPSSGRTLQHISGHRDGCNTECPGQMLYELLPEIRQDVQFVMDTCNGDSSMNFPISLEGELNAPFVASLSWAGVPQDAEIIRLEYSNERETMVRSIGIRDLMNMTEVNLRSARRYTFRIRAFLPGNEQMLSNEVVLQTGTLTDDQIYSTLFPNPAGNTINLSISNGHYGPFSVTVAAFQGNPVLDHNFLKNAVLFEKELDLSFLPPAMYVIYIYHEDFKVRKKFIKVE